MGKRYTQTLNTQVNKSCLVCNTIFSVVQSRKNDAKYCSYECFLATRQTRQPDVTLRCEYCDNEFNATFYNRNKRFCSRSCANSGENNGSYGLTGSLHPTSSIQKWNQGKTKHDDPRLKALGEKISVIIADKIVSGTFSPGFGFVGEHYVSTKNDGKETYLRSSFESRAARMLDANDEVVSWEHEPMRIPYMFEGSIHNYIPDFLVMFNDHVELWEIKPETLLDDAQNTSKRNAAIKWCDENSVIYRDITETHL